MIIDCATKSLNIVVELKDCCKKSTLYVVMYLLQQCSKKGCDFVVYSSVIKDGVITVDSMKI